MLDRTSLTTRVIDGFQTVTSRLVPLVVLSVTAVLGWQWWNVEMSDFQRSQSLGTAAVAGAVLLLGIVSSRSVERIWEHLRQRRLTKEIAIEAEIDAHLLAHTASMAVLTNVFDPAVELRRVGIPLSVPAVPRNPNET